MNTLIWLGIGLCLVQSALFSGLNLAYFSVSRMRLEVENANGNPHAQKVLQLRQDPNFLLTTILWGNVGINVLLTLLSDSVLSGITAFAFSTLFITLFGEIFPQALFSRFALMLGARLSPYLRFYQIVLYPLAKPTALLLDKLLGKELDFYWREDDVKQFITRHVQSGESEVGHVEGAGAINFLSLDDIVAGHEGEPVDPDSVISLPLKDGVPQFPVITAHANDSFIQRLNHSHHKWTVITDESGWPALLLNSDKAIRHWLSHPDIEPNPITFCFRPAVVTDQHTRLEDVLLLLKGHAKVEPHNDGAIAFDAVLLWNQNPRIITGSDILGRLLKGITPAENSPVSE